MEPNPAQCSTPEQGLSWMEVLWSWKISHLISLSLTWYHSSLPHDLLISNEHTVQSTNLHGNLYKCGEVLFVSAVWLYTLETSFKCKSVRLHQKKKKNTATIPHGFCFKLHSKDQSLELSLAKTCRISVPDVTSLNPYWQMYCSKLPRVSLCPTHQHQQPPSFSGIQKLGYRKPLQNALYHTTSRFRKQNEGQLFFLPP